MTPDGPLWTDFEDVCVGPVEWDMASMTITGPDPGSWTR
jgi:hypothetical protein